VARVLRWRRHSTAGLRGRAAALASRAWVAARSVGWLRDLRREGVRTFVRRAARNRQPGQGESRGWSVYRVAPVRGGADTRVAPVAGFAEMERRLPPAVLRLAVDRCFRGDALLLLSAGERALGVVWRAAPARRSVVTGGRDVGTAEVYYDPVAFAGGDVAGLVRALAARADGAPEPILVARRRSAAEGLEYLGAT
jgi:hypothetical protein